MENPKFVIHPAKGQYSGQFYFTLQAANGQVLVTSETYVDKHNVKEAIKDTIRCMLDSVSPTNGAPHIFDVYSADIKIDDRTGEN
ncbi:MAG: DUF1508 domain-containing protein [Chitinophagia bacterium]|nr:DUF1508 domain-containing protein [Chitinophagia bacterium]